MRNFYYLDFKPIIYSYKSSIMKATFVIMYSIFMFIEILFTSDGSNLISVCVVLLLLILAVFRFILYKDLFVNRLGAFDEDGVRIYTLMNKKGVFIPYEDFKEIRIIPANYSFINDFGPKNHQYRKEIHIPKTFRFVFSYDQKFPLKFDRDDDFIPGMSIHEYGTSGYNFSLYFLDELYEKIIVNMTEEKRKILEDDFKKSIEIMNELEAKYLQQKRDDKND